MARYVTWDDLKDLRYNKDGTLINDQLSYYSTNLDKLSKEQYESFYKWFDNFDSGRHYGDAKYKIRLFYILDCLLEQVLKDYNYGTI